MPKQGYWIPAEIEDEIIKYKFESHSLVKLKSTPWLYCRYCGLIYLKNRLSKWCIRMGCNHEYHKDYKRKLIKK